MAVFGDVIKFASSPATAPSGIGGTNTVNWHCDWNVNRVYELSTVNFSVIRSNASPAANPSGIGGDNSIVWHCDNIADRVYELMAIALSIVLRFATSPNITPFGIGGNDAFIWHCDDFVNLVYELSIADFSVIRSAAGPTTASSGIGGNDAFIWHCDWGVNHRVHELSITDFSVIRFATSPATTPTGIGGIGFTIWHCDWSVDRIYELYTVLITTHRIKTRSSQYLIKGHQTKEITAQYEVMTPPRVAHTLAIVEMTEYNGTTATPTKLTNLNFVSTDAPNAITSITTGEVSFEKWLKFRVTDFRDTIEISNLRFYYTGHINGILFTNIGIAHSIPFERPRNRISFLAHNLMADTLPITQNLSVGGSLTGKLQPGRHQETDFIVMQILIDPFIKTNININFILVYDETI